MLYEVITKQMGAAFGKGVRKKHGSIGITITHPVLNPPHAVAKLSDREEDITADRS